MVSISGLTNFSKLNYTTSTSSYTISVIPGKLYNGYIVNQNDGALTITFIVIDENNQINQLDPIYIQRWKEISFKNLLLYQIILSYSSTFMISYNIIGVNYKKEKILEIIPEINIRDFPFLSDGYYYVMPATQLDTNSIPYVDIGFNPYSNTGTPLSENITVGTSAVQVDTTTNKIVYKMILKADSANTGTISIGSSGGQNYPLSANQELHLYFVNPTTVYAIASTASQVLHVIYVH